MPTCPALRVLHLRHAVALTDLAPLGECTKLKELHLTCGATCLAPLARCAKLCALRLSGCPRLTDLSPLQGCTSLARLALRGCVCAFLGAAKFVQERQFSGSPPGVFSAVSGAARRSALAYVCSNSKLERTSF